ncbi:MAG: cytochrome c [Geobacteraceae bacterium]|nr:cytochrome c [Geobacteraceae bacterium]
MFFSLKKLPSLVIVALLPFMVLTACGDSEHETNAPAVALTASTVASTAVSAHSHSVSIPFGDVSAAPAGAVLQYRSDSVSGHSHVIALSSQQMIDLNSGMRLSLVSSAPDSGAVHIHVWNIQGGSVLYDKNCYNCHSNDQRGQNPMNVVFTTAQTNAVKNPGTAPASGSAAVTPDPNYSPGAVVTPINAASIYAGLCAGCHSLGTVDTLGGTGPNLSGKGGLVSGKYPVPGFAGHNGLTLTSEQIAALIAYFTAN